MRTFYIDESNYMSWQSGPMGIGGVIASSEKFALHSKNIKSIKVKHGFKGNFELKWTKISEKTLPMYKEIIDYIFNDKDINIRILVAFEPENRRLEYSTFYTRLHHSLMDGSPFLINNLVMDKKGRRIEEDLTFTSTISLRSRKETENISVNSERNSLIQVADILLGASTGFFRRDKIKSNIKHDFIDYVNALMPLGRSTSKIYPNKKFSLFLWGAHA